MGTQHDKRYHCNKISKISKTENAGYMQFGEMGGGGVKDMGATNHRMPAEWNTYTLTCVD
jgi:hypothetical protein